MSATVRLALPPILYLEIFRRFGQQLIQLLTPDQHAILHVDHDLLFDAQLLIQIREFTDWPPIQRVLHLHKFGVIRKAPELGEINLGIVDSAVANNFIVLGKHPVPAPFSRSRANLSSRMVACSASISISAPTAASSSFSIRLICVKWSCSNVILRSS